jgi:hypothetical protein
MKQTAIVDVMYLGGAIAASPAIPDNLTPKTGGGPCLICFDFPSVAAKVLAVEFFPMAHLILL